MSRKGGKPSVEFRVVAACCRWPTDAAAIVEAAQGTQGREIDWNMVFALAKRHRVIGFLHHGLTAAGIVHPPKLAPHYQQMRLRNLLLFREAVWIAESLAEAGIPAAFLKGIVLAELAYADQGVKQTIDNDLLVAPENVIATVELLEARGYRLIDPPGITPDRLPLLIDLIKECQLKHPETEAIIDLHWRMHTLRYLLEEPDVATDTEVVMVSDRPVPTLLGDTLMIYLAIHGARHCWARLKWLADFNALLVKLDDAQIASMRARARQAGVDPCMDSALAQCHRLLGTEVPDDVTTSRRARALVALADKLIFGDDELADQHQIPGRYMWIGAASALMLKTRPRYTAHVMWDLWVSHYDAMALPLPPPLRPLYLVITPAKRIGRAVKRGWRRLSRR